MAGDENEKAFEHVLEIAAEPAAGTEKLQHDAFRHHLTEYLKQKKQVEKAIERGEAIPTFQNEEHPTYGANPFTDPKLGITDWSNIKKIQDYFLMGFSYLDMVGSWILYIPYYRVTLSLYRYIYSRQYC
jgi:hypothetical protein